jgi:hypothetical protein
MDIILKYKEGIHPDCGKKFEVYKDIIITPFYTENFCKKIIDMSKQYKDFFENDIIYGSKDTDPINTSPWETLLFSRISPILFKLFCKHYNEFIVPLIKKTFPETDITGWFSPMIIKYDKPGQDVKLHTDLSFITLNVKLNNTYKGCDLEFPRQGWSNKQIPVGYCFLWPSKITHPHVAKKLISGEKYVISSWTHPPSWNPSYIGGSIFKDEFNK